MKDTATGEYVKGADVTSAVTGETNPGGELENIFYYLPADTFSTIDEENMYLGFFAARGAKITVDTSSVVVNVTDRAADAPQTFDKVAATVPAVSQTTLSQTSSESYTYGVSVNTKGLLTIKQNGKTIESQKLVEKGTYTFDTTLIVGDNRFQAYFTHNANSRRLYSRKDEIGIMAAEMHIMRKNLRDMVASIQDAGQKINENVSELN